MNVTDLFVVGIGFDLSGAVLLALGVIGSPEEIVKSTLTYWGISATIGRTIKDKVLGILGVTYLVMGFLLQGTAYVLTTDGARWGSTSRPWLLVVLGLGAVAASASIARLLYPIMVRREGVKAARIVPYKIGHKKVGARVDPSPYTERLEMIGRFLDYPEREEGESEPDYALRVWGVARVAPGPYPKP